MIVDKIIHIFWFQFIAHNNLFLLVIYVLKTFFQIKNLLADTLEYMNKYKSYNSILINFVQGSIWKDKVKNHEVHKVLLFFYILMIMKLEIL